MTNGESLEQATAAVDREWATDEVSDVSSGPRDEDTTSENSQGGEGLRKRDREGSMKKDGRYFGLSFFSKSGGGGGGSKGNDSHDNMEEGGLSSPSRFSMSSISMFRSSSGRKGTREGDGGEGESPMDMDGTGVSGSSDPSSSNSTVIRAPTLMTASWTDRAKYIPLRLTLEERKALRLCEASLNVSEYTDRVDVYGHSRKRRIHRQLMDLCAILSGLLVACDYKAGCDLLESREYSENERFFQMTLEVGRRYKILNPEKMRSTYGKLLYLLQDAVCPEIQKLLGFSPQMEIKTVYNFLKARGPVSLSLLQDPRVGVAAQTVEDDKRR